MFYISLKYFKNYVGGCQFQYYLSVECPERLSCFRGWGVQWNENRGRCGICGDPWNDFPKEHEAPFGELGTTFNYFRFYFREVCHRHDCPALHIRILDPGYCWHNNQPWRVFLLQTVPEQRHLSRPRSKMFWRIYPTGLNVFLAQKIF